MILEDNPDYKQLKSACGQCPFNKKIKPRGTGGSDPEVYIGQARGPFWLPCHKYCDFSDPNWKTNYNVQQCAGAAQYRANTGIAKYLPDTLLKLPKSDKVFETPEELLAHHKQISLEDATEILKITTPWVLFVNELNRAKEEDL